MGMLARAVSKCNFIRPPAFALEFLQQKMSVLSQIPATPSKAAPLLPDAKISYEIGKRKNVLHLQIVHA